MNTHFVVAYRK